MKRSRAFGCVEEAISGFTVGQDHVTSAARLVPLRPFRTNRHIFAAVQNQPSHYFGHSEPTVTLFWSRLTGYKERNYAGINKESTSLFARWTWQIGPFVFVVLINKCTSQIHLINHAYGEEHRIRRAIKQPIKRCLAALPMRIDQDVRRNNFMSLRRAYRRVFGSSTPGLFTQCFQDTHFPLQESQEREFLH